MSKDNITPFIKPSSSHQTERVRLESVRESLERWRAGKTKRNEKIPAPIWDQLFILLKNLPESKTLASLSITPVQYYKEKESRQAVVSDERKATPQAETMDFCEAQKESAIPLAYKPAKAFTTTTSVVELYRPDGMLMKIHLCTDRFEELLRAFFKG